MRCKNYRNVLLWLHNFKNSEERQQRCSHTAPSSREHCATGVSPACAGCSGSVPTFGHRCLHPLNNTLVRALGMCLPQSCTRSRDGPAAQQVLQSQTHLSGFQSPGNRYKDVHINTAPVYCTLDQENVMEEKSSVGTQLFPISFIQQCNFITKDPACNFLRQKDRLKRSCSCFLA